MKKEEKLVTEFVFDAVGEQMLKVLRILARFEYPIEDEASLQKALPDMEDEIAADVIASALEPASFPLASARNAMEKVHANLTERTQLGLPIRLIPSTVSLGPGLHVPAIRRIDEEAIQRWWACRQECLEEYADCVSAAAANPYKAAACREAYKTCLEKRCSR